MLSQNYVNVLNMYLRLNELLFFYLQVFCIVFQLYAFLFLSIYLFKTRAKPESDDSMVL